MPRSFDPARAAAAPETDLVRALFEGLTEVDTRALEAVPAVAEKWTSSENGRVWTFQLRKNARWSNGKRVTAGDFVVSWKRLIALGDKTAHRELFQNIVGFQAAKPIPPTELPEPAHIPPAGDDVQARPPATNTELQPPGVPLSEAPSLTNKKPAEQKLGVEAVDDLTLKITLITPDNDLPKLVAAPTFRPVYRGSEFVDGLLDNGVITNGPFKVSLVDKTGISLERSETYWNKGAVKLERIRFVAKDSADAALDAYKKGEIDALTNAQFEPLALKLLTPYDDFRQTTFSALNLYRFDVTRPPFGDRRVREALSIAIDREQLANAELGGATEPAERFLVLASGQQQKATFDPAKAKRLLDAAGFPNGEGMPAVKLLVNRNDTQMRVARAIARMWKQNLNLDTDIAVKELTEIDAAEASHEFDLVRHGVVLPTADEPVSLWAILGMPKPVEGDQEKAPPSGEQGAPQKTEKGGPGAPLSEDTVEPVIQPAITEENALFELHAIPLYFPRSYSLVKPYVHGFEMNGFGAVDLPGVSIDSNWQPKAQRRES